MIYDCAAAEHLHVAMPCYGNPSPWTMLSVVMGTHALRSVGIKFSLAAQPGNPYLDFTRDILVKQFLAGDATDLLFVDADVHFPPENMVKIALATRPLIGGVYRKKMDDIAYPIRFETERLWGDEDGNLEAAYVPTGFMRINRAVFEAMPALEYRDDNNDVWLNYFNSGVRDIDGRMTYEGEDTYFCRQWRALGGKVHLMPDLNFGHVGTKSWDGNWGRWVLQQATRDE
jgi:hypothetical protein